MSDIENILSAFYLFIVTYINIQDINLKYNRIFEGS